MAERDFYGTLSEKFRQFADKCNLVMAQVDFSEEGYETERTEQLVADWEDCNAVSSQCADLMNSPEQYHVPVLDLDMDCMLVQSTTPGHHHLIINKRMRWHDYEKLLTVLDEVGLLEPGYAASAKRRKASWIRTPWTKKVKP